MTPVRIALASRLTPAQLVALDARLARIASRPLGTFAADLARCRRAVRAVRGLR